MLFTCFVYLKSTFMWFWVFFRYDLFRECFLSELETIYWACTIHCSMESHDHLKPISHINVIWIWLCIFILWWITTALWGFPDTFDGRKCNEFHLRQVWCFIFVCSHEHCVSSWKITIWITFLAELLNHNYTSRGRNIRNFKWIRDSTSTYVQA